MITCGIFSQQSLVYLNAVKADVRIFLPPVCLRSWRITYVIQMLPFPQQLRSPLGAFGEKWANRMPTSSYSHCFSVPHATLPWVFFHFVAGHHTETRQQPQHSCCFLVMPVSPSIVQSLEDAWLHQTSLEVLIEKRGIKKDFTIQRVFLTHLIPFVSLHPPEFLQTVASYYAFQALPVSPLSFSVALPTAPLYFPMLSGLAISSSYYLLSTPAFMSHLPPPRN